LQTALDQQRGYTSITQPQRGHQRTPSTLMALTNSGLWPWRGGIRTAIVSYPTLKSGACTYRGVPATPLGC